MKLKNKCGRPTLPFKSEAYNNTLEIHAFGPLPQCKHENWDEKLISFSNYAFHLVLWWFVTYVKKTATAVQTQIKEK